MVPVMLLPPVTPFTFQATAVLEVFSTVALNWRVLPRMTVAAVGEIVMVTGGGGFTMVTVALPMAAGSAVLVAWMVTVAGDGTAAGAV